MPAPGGGGGTAGGGGGTPGGGGGNPGGGGGTPGGGGGAGVAAQSAEGFNQLVVLWQALHSKVVEQCPPGNE